MQSFTTEVSWTKYHLLRDGNMTKYLNWFSLIKLVRAGCYVFCSRYAVVTTLSLTSWILSNFRRVTWLLITILCKCLLFRLRHIFYMVLFYHHIWNCILLWSCCSLSVSKWDTLLLQVSSIVTVVTSELSLSEVTARGPEPAVLSTSCLPPCTLKSILSMSPCRLAFYRQRWSKVESLPCWRSLD